MASEKLKQLAEQMSFLIKLEQDSLDECVKELGSLIVSIEKMISGADSDRLITSYEMIRDRLGRDYHRIKDGYEEEIGYLQRQLGIVNAALSLQGKDEQKLQEVTDIILEEVGQVEDNNVFRDRIIDSNNQSRQEFLEVVAELRDAIDSQEEDFLEEYAIAYASGDSEDFDEGEIEEEGDDSCLLSKADGSEQDLEKLAQDCNCLCGEDGDEKPFDLAENDRVVELLKQLAEPFVDVKNKKDDSEKN